MKGLIDNLMSILYLTDCLYEGLRYCIIIGLCGGPFN